MPRRSSMLITQYLPTRSDFNSGLFATVTPMCIKVQPNLLLKLILADPVLEPMALMGSSTFHDSLKPGRIQADTDCCLDNTVEFTHFLFRSFACHMVMIMIPCFIVWVLCSTNHQSFRRKAVWVNAVITFISIAFRGRLQTLQLNKHEYSLHVVNGSLLCFSRVYSR